MTVSPVPVGILNGATISAPAELNADVTIAGQTLSGSAIVDLTLSQTYVPLDFPGMPSRPPAGSVFSDTAVGETFAPGVSITLFAFEAAAIVTAGGGSIS
jgi:hypothetical protein